MSNTDTHKTHGVDDSLIEPAADCLNRRQFAANIFKLLDGTPTDACLRIGIFGAWGSGKTTVMNFIKYQCEEEGHPVAVFHPWQFNSREEAWKGFVSSLDKGLASRKDLLSGIFKIWRFIKNIFKFGKGKTPRIVGRENILLVLRKIRQIVRRENILLVLRKIRRIVGRESVIKGAIDELILAPLENQLEESKDNVNKELKNILGKKRLYVFIDDLDRAKPEIVYDLLMLLNEVIDIDQCIYVIGLDDKTVSDILRKKLGDDINPKEFIDKIINWPFELPIPSSFDWEALLNREYEKYEKMALNIKKDDISAILPLLPKNPRKFKHYLRYLDSLHQGFLDRFDDDEFNWKILYLAQLLRLEFPEVFRDFIQSNKIIDLFPDKLQEAFTKDTRQILEMNETGNEQQDWEDKIKEELKKYKYIDIPRFLYLSKEFLKYCDIVVLEEPEKYISKHLLVLEVPMTRKEYREYKNELLAQDDPVIKEELKKFITSSTENKDIEKVREFIKMLFSEQKAIFDTHLSLHLLADMKTKIDEIKEIMYLCDLLADVDELYRCEKPILDEETFMKWYSTLLVLINPLLRMPEVEGAEYLYKAIPILGKASLLLMIEKNLDQVSEMSEWLYDDLKDSSDEDIEKATAELNEEIKDILYEELTDDLIDRFNKIDGIRELTWGPGFRTERDFLFESDSLFYSEEFYDKLKAVADKAEENDAIQGNFVQLLLWLIRPITKPDPDRKSYDELVKIVQKKSFTVIWEAVMCCCLLNTRCIRTLGEGVEKLERNQNLGKDYFTRPKKWIMPYQWN